MSYNSLLPLLKKTGSVLSPEKFQERINIVFHDFEANHYDSLHTDMWGSLQQQMDLLVDDLFQYKNFANKELSLLDVGCGTGLRTQILLNSKLGNHINQVTLLDTSSNMLKRATEKAKIWNIKYKTSNSYLADLNEKFDVIIISSVLHHIPDLVTFLKQVNNKLNSGGVLIHLQDPNGDYLDDSVYKERKKLYEKELEDLPKKNQKSYYLPKNIIRLVKRVLNKKDYIDLINDQLLAEKTIKKRMTAYEIWTVTDIHVETKSDTVSKGISLNFLKKQLENFQLIRMRSYGFYGFLKSDLLENYKENEEKFIQENQLNGRNLACVWVKK
jgi:2-polyprenyl-3-methyl-5-hydroxy-6-metoxy-1,4-benzoquinol methylase